jgi:hypothetical protein
MMIECDQNGVTANFFESNDTSCTNSTSTFYLPVNICTSGSLFTCEFDTQFLKKWKNEVVDISYRSYFDASTNNLLAADGFVVNSDISLNIISNLKPWNRNKCAWWLIPDNQDCVDTTDAKSIAYIAKGFNYGIVNFYNRFMGEGKAESVNFYFADYYFAGSWSYIAERAFTKDWYEDYINDTITSFISPTITPSKSPINSSDECYDLGNYWCYNNGCVSAAEKAYSGCPGGHAIPAYCPEFATCTDTRYKCNEGYNDVFNDVNPQGWGDWCQYCTLPHGCAPIEVNSTSSSL